MRVLVACHRGPVPAEVSPARAVDAPRVRPAAHAGDPRGGDAGSGGLRRHRAPVAPGAFKVAPALQPAGPLPLLHDRPGRRPRPDGMAPPRRLRNRGGVRRRAGREVRPARPGGGLEGERGRCTGGGLAGEDERDLQPQLLCVAESADLSGESGQSDGRGPVPDR